MGSMLRIYQNKTSVTVRELLTLVEKLFLLIPLADINVKGISVRK
jgi:hypothetical protein